MSAPGSVFRLLRESARGWWYHRQLREQGQHAEARRREHASVRGNLENIREASASGGYLSIGRGGWALHIGPNATLSGYGDTLPAAFIAAGIPTIDSRPISDADIIKTIRFPMVRPGLRSGEVNRCPEIPAYMSAGLEGSFAALAAVQTAARCQTPAPGPLDEAALEDVAPLYAALGARLYNFPEEVPQMRSAN